MDTDPPSLSESAASHALNQGSRPKIPAALQRDLLIECGHRCSTCGNEAALEFAHIIPWHKCREHQFENLVVLCAQCHARADREKWGPLTLEKYKDTPWIINRQKYDRSLVTIHINNIDLARFGHSEITVIRQAISVMLSVSLQDVEIVSKEQGSVILTFSLPSVAADKFHIIYSDGINFEQLMAVLLAQSQSLKETGGNIQWGTLSRAISHTIQWLMKQGEEPLARLFLETNSDFLLDIAHQTCATGATDICEPRSLVGSLLSSLNRLILIERNSQMKGYTIKKPTPIIPVGQTKLAEIQATTNLKEGKGQAEIIINKSSGSPFTTTIAEHSLPEIIQFINELNIRNSIFGGPLQRHIRPSRLHESERVSNSDPEKSEEA